MRSVDVRRVMGTGVRRHGTRVVVVRAPGNGATAVVAGRKVGGAVERNRARRILRAALRETRKDLSATQDVILVARASIRGCGTKDLVSDLRELMRT